MLQVAAIVIVIELYTFIACVMASQYQKDYDKLLEKDKHAAEAMLQATTHVIF